MKTKHTIRIILNILIAGGFIAILINMLVKVHTGVLVSSGVEVLKFFTTLSNLLEAVAALIWVIFALVKKGKVSGFLEGLKYVAAVQVFVTFLTIVAFLAPIYGFAETCSGNNFWLHIVIPLAAILEQIFLAEKKMGFKENLIVVLPPLVYGIAYVINIIVNGKGEYPDTNDWYGFLNWGIPIGIAIFIGICIMAFLLGLLFRGLWKLASGQKSSETN